MSAGAPESGDIGSGDAGSDGADIGARLAEDAAARHRLRTSLGESLMVEAAAGTGKTTVLVDRLVATLAAGDTTVERVVAVTFTRKAAGELKLRLRQQLDRARSEVDATSPEHSHLTDAIARLEEAHIGTIHSFCAELLRRRPVEARVDPTFVEIDQEEAHQLYGQAFRTWIEGRLEAMPSGLSRILRRLALQRSFDGLSPLDRLQLAGRDLVDWRDFETPWRLDPNFDRDAAVNGLLERLETLDAWRRRGSRNDALYGELEPIHLLVDATRRTEQDAPARDFDELEGRLLELLRELRRQRPRRGGAAAFAPDLPRRDVQEARVQLIEALEDFERQANADLAARLRLELVEVLTAYEDLKRSRGQIDFLDLLLRCRDLLVSSAEARADFQAAFTHLFVDEFQDTDPLQAEILVLLSADDGAETDWRQVHPRPGSLLLVGDPKQSIYRFRRADVVFYQGIKRRLQEGGVDVLILSRSFRAPAPLQAALNGAFSSQMREDFRAGQPAYVPLAGDLDAPPDQPFLVGLPVPKPFGPRGWPTAKAIDESLPAAVAAWIRWLLHDSGFTVRDPQTGERVPVQARHVCVLFRRYLSWGRDVTAPYLRALEGRGVPHVLVGGRTLHQREEIDTLRAALAAIEWPDDTLSVYATLRGAFFGFTDDALLRFRTAAGHLDPFKAQPDGLEDGGADPAADPEFEEIGDALETLATWHRERNAIPFAQTIHRLFAHSRAHAAFALRPAGHQVLANVERVADMARAYEARGGLSFRGFVDQLEDAASRPGSGSGPLVEEGAEGVRVMTVHSAKGLEFPVVLLADPTCSLAPREPGLHLDAEKKLCARRLLGLTPWELHEHRELEMDRDKAESVRLAYVAATRVRDLLVIPGLGTRPWSGGWLSPLDAALYPAPGSQARPAPGCPPFGPSTMLGDPRSYGPGHGAPIKPGLHRSRAGGEAVWWDPSTLELRAPGLGGVSHPHLLAPDEDGEAFERGLDRYLDWEGQRRSALEAGAEPSLETLTVTETERWPPGDLEVRHESVERQPDRPSGRRFGTLVHAVLHDAGARARGAGPDARQLARLHGRLLSASGAEVDAAAEACEQALAHPLWRLADEAERVLREVPFTLRHERDLLIEGVIDLAFFDGGRWTVVDFKTDADPGPRLESYRRQIAWYVFALSELTGQEARGVLLSV
ncbi:MAG: UvrD-helicase domain-containing protein [Acidobacteriota bacterium]